MNNRHRPTRLLALGALAAGATWLGIHAPTAIAQETPGITITGDPTTVTQGDTIDYDARCWREDTGPGTDALVSVSRRATDPPSDPFSVDEQIVITNSQGNFSGHLVVPLDAPAGAYNLGVLCLVQDQVIGRADTPITIEGEPITTTSTTAQTTTSTQTTTTSPGPATPVAGVATYTG